MLNTDQDSSVLFLCQKSSISTGNFLPVQSVIPISEPQPCLWVLHYQLCWGYSPMLICSNSLWGPLATWHFRPVQGNIRYIQDLFHCLTTICTPWCIFVASSSNMQAYHYALGKTVKWLYYQYRLQLLFGELWIGSCGQVKFHCPRLTACQIGPKRSWHVIIWCQTMGVRAICPPHVEEVVIEGSFSVFQILFRT